MEVEAEDVEAEPTSETSELSETEVHSSTEALRDLVEYMATNLVDQPESVSVTAEQRGSAVHLDLRLPQEELGKVIGRQGRIARAMRTVVMIAGTRYNVRASLDIDG